MKKILDATIGDFKRCWKQLFFTALCYQLVSFAILTPLVSILFRLFIAASGKTVLADQDIVFFFASPIGWGCLLSVGAMWIAISALELAALMVIVADRSAEMGPVRALRFALTKAWPTIQVASRGILKLVLVALPFLAVAGIVYWLLLGEFDINYYLKETPTEFIWAVGIGGVIVVLLLAVALRLISGWAFALPMVLFEDVAPNQALALSQTKSVGRRKSLVGWILAWAIVGAAASSLLTALFLFSGKWIIPFESESLQTLAVFVGMWVLVWSLLNTLIGLTSVSILASLSFNLYRFLASDDDACASWELTAEKESGPRFKLTRPRLLALCIVGFVGAIAIGFFVMQSVALDHSVEVIAHRGASGAAPENTMAAIRQAIEDGADWVEIDVQEISDGSVVVFHDSDFMKLAKDPTKIWEATPDDLNRIDVGSWFDPKFKDQRVPTLESVLAECKGKTGLFIELKYYGHQVDLEKKVVELVEAHGMADDVVIISLKLDGIQKIKTLRPKWKVGLLMSVATGNLGGIDAEMLAVNAAFVNRPFVRSADGMGKQVCVWTVNDAVTMSYMIGAGVSGLITDEPALARSVIQQRENLGLTERLVLELAGFLGVEPPLPEQ